MINMERYIAFSIGRVQFIDTVNELHATNTGFYGWSQLYLISADASRKQ